MKTRRAGQQSLFDATAPTAGDKKSGAAKNTPAATRGAAQKNNPKVDVVIVLSHKRKRTVSARWEGGSVRVMAPARMPRKDLDPVVEKLVHRLLRERENRLPHNIDLEVRAAELNEKYFGGRLRWTSIRFVSNQQMRHGSCSPRKGVIRISHKLASYPLWVLDYVLIHEMAHLLEANHGKRFWDLVSRYPMTERARGFLIAKDLEHQEEAI